MKNKITLLFLFLYLVSNAQCWKQVSCGSNYSMAIKNDGTLWGWGYASYGSLGSEEAIMDYRPVQMSTIPLQVGTETNWKIVATGALHTIAVKNDGTLWGWGFGSSGAVGNTGGDFFVPTQIGFETNWDTVSAGNNFTVALKSDGTIWTFGSNYYGELGNGNNVDKEYSTPVQVGADSNWSKISAGGFHTLALKNDGTLWAWGLNVFNQLGDGTSNSQFLPVQIGSATDWKVISAGINHNLAVKNDGELWAWGTNTDKELGDGTNKTKKVPTRIGSDTNWKTVSAGGYFSVGIKNDGSIFTWGVNYYGQLGDGTKTTQGIPTNIATSSTFSQVDSGLNHSLAINTDGNIASWGANLYGSLGNGSSEISLLPVEIACTQSDLAINTYLLNKEIVTLYPNPASENININTPYKELMRKLKINDVTGKEILSIENPSQTINISKLQKGIYFIQIDYRNSSSVLKFIKK